MRPVNKLAVEAGLEVGPRGGIRVNEHLQTSDPNIYAVRDAIEVQDALSGDPTEAPLAGPATRPAADRQQRNAHRLTGRDAQSIHEQWHGEDRAFATG